MFDSKTLSIPRLVACESKGDGLGEIPSINKEYRQAGKTPPKKVFDLIQEGFIESFIDCRYICSLWFKELKADDSTESEKEKALNSDVFQRITNIKDYVLYGKYKLTNNESENFNQREYKNKINRHDLSSLPILDDLFEDIEAVYTYWLFSEKQISRSNDERSINFRCLALFALTAWTRFRLDFGAAGDFRPQIDNKNYSLKGYSFTIQELALLCGKARKTVVNEVSDYRNINNNLPNIDQQEQFIDKNKHGLKSRIFSDGIDGHHYNEVSEYIAPGNKTKVLEAFVSHKDAIIFLTEQDGYQESTFSSYI